MNMKRLVEDVVALNESVPGKYMNAPMTGALAAKITRDARRDGPKRTTSSSDDTTELTPHHWRHLVHITHKLPMPRLSEKDSETRQSLKKKGLIERDGADWKPTKLGANMVVKRISQLHKLD